MFVYHTVLIGVATWLFIESIANIYVLHKSKLLITKYWHALNKFLYACAGLSFLYVSFRLYTTIYDSCDLTDSVIKSIIVPGIECGFLVSLGRFENFCISLLRKSQKDEYDDKIRKMLFEVKEYNKSLTHNH